jgi:RHS repeat-associated protein
VTGRLTRCGMVVLGLLAAATVEAPLWAQHPNVARGFTPSGMFDVGGIDTVNGFNGNLSIRIPLGGSYPAGGPMGAYSFSVTYNSHVWDHLSRDGLNGSLGGGGTPATSVYAVPDPFAEAGLGWSFSLGRIGNLSGGVMSNGWALNPPLYQGRTTFHAADGTEHVLFDSRSAPGGDGADGSHWFSNDGSHLRYEPNSRVLELPNGTRETFNESGYPTSVLDRFGNGLTIGYTYFASAPEVVSQWTISDGFRTHFVHFRLTGYAWPLQRAVVDSIQLAKFGGGFATYRFLYNGEDELGNGFQNVAMTGFGTQLHLDDDTSWQPNVYVLTQLILPDGTHYSMPLSSYLYPAAPCGATNDCQGSVGRLELPTGGAMEWDYELRPMPQPRSDSEHQWTIPTWSFSVQVARRRLYDEHGFVGEWKYGYADGDLGIDTRPNEIVKQVTHPPAEPGLAGVRVLTYYSACVYGVCSTAGQPDAYASEYGLPFSRLRTGDGAGRFLSQEIYPGGPAGSTVPVRRIYARYDNDGPAGFAYDTTHGMPQLNQRLQSQLTVFLDDMLPAGKGSAWAAVDSSNYDGLGHYREVKMTDNFGYGTARTERMHWNPNGAPSGSQPWLLNLFDYQEQQEGSSLARQEFLFEPDTGFLSCKRLLKNGRNHGPFDVLVSYEHTDNALPGFVTVEKYYGGNGQNIEGKDCSALPATATYVYNHAYTAGARRETTVEANTILKLLDADVDAPSGLALATRDVSGRRTDYGYDAMGRLTSSAPVGDVPTGIEYRTQSVPFVVDQTVGTGASSLGEQRVTLDGLGRVIRDEVKMPGDTWSASVAAYNPMGWKLYESERSASPAVTNLATRCEQPGKGTAYCDFDAFGRPGRIVTADGKLTRLDYQGARVVLRTRRVWDGKNEVGGTTREEYDSLGRLRRIREPNLTWTYYWYDMGGRLSSVTANAKKTQQQTRTFHYDGRGFLDREVQPESGTVTYEYDAQGNVTKMMTPTGTILYGYDTAGRLIQVETPQGPLRKLAYFASGSATGKLEQARAFNDRQVGSSCLTYEVRQDFAYNSSHGRLQTEATSLFQGGTALEKWSQGYTYDGAGEVTTFSYPSCLAGCNAAPRSQTVSYTMGRPTAVPGIATSIAYSGNGMVSTIAHANGVVFSQVPDASGMARPGSLSTNRDWQEERYLYDASGNIEKIGAKQFAYDLDSRLTSATLPGVSEPYRGYAYDAFGNLTQVAQGASAGVIDSYVNYTADTKTNRLIGAAYDTSGKLLSYQGSSYSWDVLGNLTAVNTGTERWVHTYDASGERVWSWRTSPTRVDNYTFRGLDSKVLSAFTKTGSAYTWEDYVYGGQLLAAKYSDGKTVHFDLDHLGSVRQETDASGAVIKYRDFWPYGEEATPPSGTERMKFTGHERDLGDPSSTADDMDYMHARYYKPLLGRFLSPDPSNGAPASPQSWNRYAYVQGRPLIFTDPTGRVLEFSGSDEDKQKMEEIANSGMFGQELKIDANGNATLVSNGQAGPPTQEQATTAALLGSVIANPGTTSIKLVSGDTSSLMGHFSEHKLDVADVGSFGTGPGPTKAATAVHEIVEQFAGQVSKVGQKDAHQLGIRAENAAGGYDRGRDSLQLLNGGTSARITTTYTMRVGSPVTVVLVVTNGNVISVTRP